MFGMLATSLSAMAQQLPNVGFNSWKSTCGSTYQTSTGKLYGTTSTSDRTKVKGLRQRPGTEPEGWNGSNVNQNVMADKQEPNLVTKATDDSHGSYLKLANRFIGMGSIGATAPAYITFGTPWSHAVSNNEEQDGGTYGGVNFTYRPDAIRGKFKRINVEGKSENAHIIVYMWTGTFTSNIGEKGAPLLSENNVDRAIMGKSNAGTVTGDGKLIASADHEFATTLNNDWEEITVPINYADTKTAPQMMNVIVSSADYWTRDNIVDLEKKTETKDKDASTLYVDDLEFVYYNTLKSLTVNGKNITLQEGTTTYSFDEELTSVEAEATSQFATITYEQKGSNYVISLTSGDGKVTEYTIKGKSNKPAPVASSIAGTYESRIDVTLGEDDTFSSINNIVLEANQDNTVNFLLNNFTFPGIGEVGDIAVKNVPLSWNGDNVALETKQNISLDSEYADALNLKNMPLDLYAEVSPEKQLTAQLTIVWSMEGFELPITVTVKKSPIGVTTEGTTTTVTGTVDEEVFTNIIPNLLEGKTSLDFTDANITYSGFWNHNIGINNIVYYVNNDLTSPNTNLVNNGTTVKLQLTDKEDFGVPQSFTAEEVSYSRDPLTADNSYVSSFVLPFAFDVPAGTTVAELNAINGTTLVFKPVSRTEANKPYLIVTNNAEVLTSFRNVAVEATDNANLTTTVDGVKHIGTYTEKKVENVYGYANGKFVKAKTGTVSPFRTYIEMPNTASAPKAFNISFEEGGSTTGINQTTAAENSSNAVYNLQGIRMGNDLNGLAKGIYIVNGKKVIK